MRALLVFVVLALSATALAQGRAEIAGRLARVHQGMSEQQAIEIVGRPDDTLSRLDPEIEPSSIVTRVLSWGASTHGAFPAVGSVEIDEHGQVFSVCGGGGTPLTAMPEPELRAHLMRLAAVTGLDGTAFDARPLIRAVNALLPLGKERALAVIGEYLRVAPPYTTWDSDGVFFVLRTLFDPPAGLQHPPMLVGSPIPAPADEHAFPAFPLVVIDDVPLLLINSYMLGGEAQPPAQHLPWYAQHGVLRRAPLTPSAQPLAVLDRFLAERRAGSFHDVRNMLMEQLLRLVADAYRPAGVAGDTHFEVVDPMPRWQVMTREITALAPRWDAALGGYRAPNVAPQEHLRSARQRWAQTHGDLDYELLLERRSPASVRYWLHITRHGSGNAEGRIRLSTSDGRTFLNDPIAVHAGNFGVADVPLTPAQSIRVHLEPGGPPIDAELRVP